MDDQEFNAPSIWHVPSLNIAEINSRFQGGLSDSLGIVFVDYGGDWLAAEMPVDDRTVQPFGRLHGGASVALAETVASAAGSMTLDPGGRVAVGMEINANHVRPVGRGLVRAVARAEALQHTTQIWSIRITDEAGRLICISRMTLAIISRAKAIPG